MHKGPPARIFLGMGAQMDTPEELREKAARCRRLAGGIAIRNDPTAKALLEMARRLEQAADELTGVQSNAVDI